MKIKYLLLAAMLAIVLPQVLLSFETDAPQRLEIIHTKPNEAERTENTILVKDDSSVLTLDFEDYICGVVLAEMPSEFELEALKSQAVAARTYTLYRIMKGSKHQNAVVCTDSTCCQAYQDISQNDKSVDRVKSAVKETEGQVLIYHGNLIEATYFSCSGGKTEDAVAVWGSAVPYLRSVDSPGEEICKHFEDSAVYSTETFLSKLGLSQDQGISNEDISVTYTAGGGVDTIRILGENYTGVEMRSLLELKSTAFTVDVVNNTVCITTRGNGHRVGMSQYGAEAMAMEGKDYTQILKHYYSGTELQTFSPQQMHAIFDKEINL